MKCIEATIKEINTAISNNIKIDRYFFYENVIRHTNSTGSEFNVSDRGIEFSEEVATWDDRYDLVWFNRVNSIRATTDQAEYGRTRFKLTQEASCDLVVWAKTSILFNNTHKFITNLQLYELIASIMLPIENTQIEFVELDNTAVEAREFKRGVINKDSFCFSINYSIVNTINKNCNVNQCNIITDCG